MYVALGVSVSESCTNDWFSESFIIIQFINVTGYAVIFGLTSATETLCSQVCIIRTY